MSVFDEIKKMIQKPSETLALPIPERSCKEDPCYYYSEQLGYYGYCNKMNQNLRINLANTCPLYLYGLPYQLLKKDIEDMKATIGTLKSMKVVSAFERKGGGINLNQYNDDTVVTTSQENVYQLAKTFNVNTPTFPAEIAVLKFAILVSVEYKRNPAEGFSWIRVDVDDVTIGEASTQSGSYVWEDFASEISAGSHTVKIYIKHTTSANGTSNRGARNNVGVGSIGTTETKILMIGVTGEGSFAIKFGSRCYKASVTLTGIAKFDESPADYTGVDQTITTGGALIEKNVIHSGTVFSESDVYGKTSSANVPIFVTASETKTEKVLT